MNKIIETKKQELIDICKELKINKLSIFGSVLSERFSDSSDLDFLISFDDRLTIEEYTENYFKLHYKLREIFKRNVDITTEKTLSNPFLIRSINETKELIYEDRN